MEARAVAKNVRISPKKARPVADLVRDKSVTKAFNILENTHKRATEQIRKAIKSAASNLQQEDPAAQFDAMELKELRVDDGPTLKRFKPRAMGRASPINKRSSHITAVVEIPDNTEDV
jgi:large subunit ribosomal protein L22